MRIELRVVVAFLLALGLILVCIATIVIFAAVGGPWLGLGEEEQFVFFKAWGASRTETLVRGVQVLAVGSGLCAIPLYGQLRAQINNILSEEPRPPSGPLVKALAVAAVKTGPMVVQAWEFLNRDWMATFFLLPFAVYVGGFALFVLPGIPWVFGDTGSYIMFYPIRTLLYPLGLRVAALFSDNPIILVGPFLVAGLCVTLFFAEVIHRLFRNFLVSFLVGMAVLFSGPLMMHGVSILSDYPFYTCLTASMGFALLAFRNPRPQWLLLLALTGGLAVWIRPLGIITFLAIPFILVIYTKLWRRITSYLILPTVIFIFIQASLNFYVLDYFGLSKAAGLGTAANSALLLKADTPTPHPDLRDRLLAMAVPYQRTVAEQKIDTDRLDQVYNATNPLLKKSAKIVFRYGVEKGIVTWSDYSRHKELLQFLNNLSPLNKAIAGVDQGERSYSAWLNDILSQMGRAAHLHNLSGFVDLTVLKLRYSWKYFLPTLPVNRDLTVFRRFDPTLPRYGISRALTEKPREDVPFLTIANFNGIAAALKALYDVISVPAIVLAVTIFSIIAAATARFRGRHVDPKWTCLAYLGCFVVFYHVMISVGAIPLLRYLMVPMAASATLYFMGLDIISTAARWLWWRYSMHLI